MKKLLLLIGLVVLVSGSVFGKSFDIYCGSNSKTFDENGGIENKTFKLKIKINLDNSSFNIYKILVDEEFRDVNFQLTITKVIDGVIHASSKWEDTRIEYKLDMVNLRAENRLDDSGNIRIIEFCDRNLELANALGVKSKDEEEIKEASLLAITKFQDEASRHKAQAQVDAQQKKIETCSAYKFKEGSEEFAQCIFKLMELDLEYAKLENERLRLQAQAEQAKLNNDNDLAQSLAMQSMAASQDKSLRIQQFGMAMQSIQQSLKYLETPSSMINPKITCNEFGSQFKCW